MMSVFLQGNWQNDFRHCSIYRTATTFIDMYTTTNVPEFDEYYDKISPTYSQTRQELLQEKLQDRRGEANYIKLMLRLSVDDEELLLLLLRLLPSPPFQWNPHWKCFIGLCRELKAQEAFSNVMIGTLAGMTAITTVSIGPKIGRIAQKR